MLMSEAEVSTTKAKGYLQQLCNHFGHKIKVEQSADHAWFFFQSGKVFGQAREGSLLLRAEAESPSDLAKAEQVAASHLERFAFRENLSVIWTQKSA